MPDQDEGRRSPQELRRQAEEIRRQRPSHDGSIAPEEALRLLHELEVHQIELEMQNEELRRVHEQLEAARARYFDLFDLAPVGYLSVSESGTILLANLTAANLLRRDRRQLVGQPISRFIYRDDQDVYYLSRERLFTTQEPQVCELRMLRADRGSSAARAGEPLWVLISAVVANEGDGTVVCQATLSDLTERKQAEERQAATQQALQASQEQLQRLSRRLIDREERERRYVADQLWNDVGQALTALMIRIGQQNQEAVPAGQVAETNQILDRVMQDLHRLAAQMRSAVLDQLGLAAAIRQYGEDWGRSQGVEVEIGGSDPVFVRLPDAVETTVYRLVQEALKNTAQHARATRVAIYMSEVEGQFRVLIADNGVGFDVSTALRDGAIGLLDMHERAEAVGGEVAVESEPESGTTVTIVVPSMPQP